MHHKCNYVQNCIINPLNPNISMQLHHTVLWYIFFVLFILLLDSGVLDLGEIRSLSLLEIKR